MAEGGPSQQTMLYFKQGTCCQVCQAGLRRQGCTKPLGFIRQACGGRAAPSAEAASM